MGPHSHLLRRLRWNFAQPSGPRRPSALPSLTRSGATRRPCGRKKPDFWPVSKFNTLRGILPVTSRGFALNIYGSTFGPYLARPAAAVVLPAPAAKSYKCGVFYHNEKLFTWSCNLCSLNNQTCYLQTWINHAEKISIKIQLLKQPVNYNITTRNMYWQRAPIQDGQASTSA